MHVGNTSVGKRAAAIFDMFISKGQVFYEAGNIDFPWFHLFAWKEEYHKKIAAARFISADC